MPYLPYGLFNSASLCLALAIFFVKCSSKFWAESIQKPSHQVAPLLKGMDLPFPMFILLLGLYFWFFFTNRMASVFAMSNSTAFCSAHLVAISAHFSSVIVISDTLSPEAIHDRSSTKDTLPLLKSRFPLLQRLLRYKLKMGSGILGIPEECPSLSV